METKMKKFVLLTSFIAAPFLYSQNASAFFVFDLPTEANTLSIDNTTKSILGTDKEISKNTSDILDTDKKILDTVEKTLKAITGDRTKDSQTASAAAGQTSTSANSTPSLASQAATAAIDNISKMATVTFGTTATPGDGKTKNPSLQASATTTVDLGAIIAGA